MYELAPNEFLFLFYSKLTTKLKRILELMELPKRNAEETKELYETKSNMVEAVEILVFETNDDKLREAYMSLMQLIGSSNKKDIESAIDYCIMTRT